MTPDRANALIGHVAIALLFLGLGAMGKPALAAKLDELGDYAFVASRKSSEITILSTKDDRIAGRLDLSLIPDQIIVSENHRKLIAAHGRERRISLVDLDLGEVASIIELDFEPNLIQIDDDAGVVAVGGGEAGKVVVISLEREEALFTIEGLPHPVDLMFNRDARHLLIAHGDEGVISIVDMATGELAETLTLEAADDGIAELVRTPGGKTGLALHGESGLISALDLDARAQVGATTLSAPAYRGFPSANSQYFLIPNGEETSMSLVSSWTYRESQSLPSLASVAGVNFAMFDTLAFALGGEGGSGGEALAVSLLETPRPNAIKLPGHPETGLTVALGTKLYVALSDTDQVVVIDTLGERLIGVIDDVGDEPWAITAAGGLGYCH